MTAVECKAFIDEDILTSDQFKDQDKMIRTIIKGKRDSNDVWYNAVVINMNDADMGKSLLLELEPCSYNQDPHHSLLDSSFSCGHQQHWSRGIRMVRAHLV